MKQKLLFIITQMYRGGAEIALWNLLCQIDYNRFQVELLVLNQYPVANAQSLLERMPAEVIVCNAYMEQKKWKLLRKIKAKCFYSTFTRSKYASAALDFVWNKEYDWAFWVGEWAAPEFLVRHVSAKYKSCWIHTDLSCADHFDAETYFEYVDNIDYFIFVSKGTMDSSIVRYPFIKEKSVVIYNISNTADINRNAVVKTDDPMDYDMPVLVTCANIRKEKNHLRQVEAMKVLRDRGMRFKWINIGLINRDDVAESLIKRIEEYQLQDDFILLDVKKNPYAYIAKATAVTVLSDYESWSMVITEAKILGIPVIATKTAGALEQLEHEKTGLLAEHTVNSIADNIERLLTDQILYQRIKNNIKNYDNTESIMNSFYSLISNELWYESQAPERKGTLFVTNDINYCGGAHGATILQILHLMSLGHRITIFSESFPSVETRKRLLGSRFLSWEDVRFNQLFHERIGSCVARKRYSWAEKRQKVKMTAKAILLRSPSVFLDMVYPKTTQLFDGYDVVCVMSEASGLRSAVAEASVKKKIQWIHTDYDSWSNWNDWTRKITRQDEQIYQKFDHIVLLSGTIKRRFLARYPSLTDKAMVLANIIPSDEIMRRADVKKEYPPVRFVTVARLGKEKGIPRLLNALKQLMEDGYAFQWDIVGDGPEREDIEARIKKLALLEYVKMYGERQNPFLVMKEAQVFALLSHYEGLPNSIYEAFLLDLPVLATDVGGVRDQVTPGENGWLIESGEEAILCGIRHILENQQEISQYKMNLENYKYDNDAVYKELGNLFGAYRPSRKLDSKIHR